MSDFWFDSAVALAAMHLPAPQLARFQDAWQAARQEVVQPRLVLRLDPPSATTPHALPATARGSIWIPATWRRRLDEAIAAIEAMQ